MSQFLSLYETARFSSAPLSETSFRQLMNLFAALLRGMDTLDEDAFAEAYATAAAAASDENNEGVSLYSTTSRSSSTRSFITSGDAPHRSAFIPPSDGPHDVVDDSASIHTTSTVAHYHLPPSPSSSSSQRWRTKRPPLQDYITNSSYRSARPGLRTPSIASLGPVVVGEDGSIHHRSVSSSDSLVSTNLGSVIRLSEEGGVVLDLPVGEDYYETVNHRGEFAGEYGHRNDDVNVNEFE